MTQLWTIVSTTTGVVLAPCFVTPSMGSHPKDNGWPWDASSQRAVRIDAAPDLALQVWSGTAWIEDAAKVEALLIAKVKADNEARVRSIYSTNYGKQKKYSRKQQEVLDFRTLPGTAGLAVANALTATLTAFVPGFATLTAAQQAKKFRFAMAEAAARGVSVATVIGWYEAAIDAKEQQVANWEAVEMKAIADLKAASTAAAKRAVYAAIIWG